MSNLRKLTVRTFLSEMGLPFTLLAVMAAIVLAQANPYLTRPNPDGGFNMYAGSEILKGKTPYIDFWNTKGPAIYYLNALGLYLAHGLRWGVWAIEYVFLLSALILLFILLQKKWGLGPAAFGLIIGMIGLNLVLNNGNLTEEYSLPFNCAALYLFWREEATARPELQEAGWSRWRYVLIGCMAGLSFSFRANNIGLPAAIGLAILVVDGMRHRFGRALLKIGFMAAGFAVPVLISVGFLWYKGALSEFVGAVYLYNVRYSGARGHSALVLLAGFTPDKLGWTAWIALAGAIVAVVQVVRRIARREAPTGLEVILATVLWIEIGLSSLSARMFGHYFITWMPALALLSAYLLAQAIGLFRPNGVTNFVTGSQPLPVLAGLILGLILVGRGELGQYVQTANQMLFHRGEGIVYKDYLSNYVDRHTQPGEQVLTWPGDAWINFSSEREAPVRLVFYPMFDAGTITEEQGKSYLEDLQAHKPALVIDCSDLQNEVPSLDPATRQIQYATRDFLFDPPYLREVFDYVEQNYHVETTTSKCTIYRVNP